MLLLLPAFDEDGRVAFWESAASGAGNARIVRLADTGTQVEWAWGGVIGEMQKARR